MGNVTTYADAKAREVARRKLKELIDAGRATDAEKREYLRLLASERSDRQAAGETAAGFRGMQHGLTMGLADEARGALSAIGAIATGGDPGAAYRRGRDIVRAKDRAALASHPDAFNRGEMAGAATSLAVPVGVGSGFVRGAGGLAKTVMGAGLGGVAGGNAGIQRAQLEGRPLDTVGDYVDAGAPSAVVGAALGGAAYPVGAAVGKVARRVVPAPRVAGMSRGASGQVRNALRAARRSGLDPLGDLGAMTSEGMLADTSAFIHQAQGLATRNDEPGYIVRRAVEARARGASKRLEGDASRFLGDPRGASDERSVQRALRRRELSPRYQEVLRGQNVDLQPILAELDRAKAEVAGPALRELERYGRELQSIMEPGGTGTTAARLHSIRSTMAAELRKRDRTIHDAGLRRLLGAIDERLSAVPGYAKVKSDWAVSMRIEDLIDEGNKAFSGGRVSAMTPDDVRAYLRGLKPEERAAFRKGAREAIYRMLGTARNDIQAAAGEFGKGFNEEKMRIIFGAKPADAILKRIRSEKRFATTRNRIQAGSDTAFRDAARRDLQRAEARDDTTGLAINPVRRGTSAVYGAANNLLDTIFRGARSRQQQVDIARALVAQGPEAERIVRSALAAQGVEVTRDAVETMVRTVADSLTRAGGSVLAVGAAQHEVGK